MLLLLFHHQLLLVQQLLLVLVQLHLWRPLQLLQLLQQQELLEITHLMLLLLLQRPSVWTPLFLSQQLCCTNRDQASKPVVCWQWQPAVLFVMQLSLLVLPMHCTLLSMVWTKGHRCTQLIACLHSRHHQLWLSYQRQLQRLMLLLLPLPFLFLLPDMHLILQL